jgi:hypothetical protein
MIEPLEYRDYSVTPNCQSMDSDQIMLMTINQPVLLVSL